MQNFEIPNYKNKTFLITGAAGALGATLALDCAKYGARVLLLGKDPYKLAKVHDKILEHNYPEPYIVPLNLAGATLDDYTHIYDLIVDQFGSLDALIHTAATLGPKTPFDQYPTKDWYEVMQVNVNAAFLLTQALLPALKKSPHAAVIFTLANEAFKAPAYHGAYTVSKFALHGLMQLLAQEHAAHSNLKVHGVNPIALRSKLRKQSFPGEDAQKIPTAEHIMPLYHQILSGNATHAACLALEA